MLVFAIYFNFVFVFIGALSLFITSLIKSVKKKSNIIGIALIVFSILELVMLRYDIIEFDWNELFLVPIAFVSLILSIVGVIVANARRKTKTDKMKIGIELAVILAPVILFAIPYSYETYIINNCDYIITYNYQNGFVTSDDTYIALTDGKTTEINLREPIVFGKKEHTFNARGVGFYSVYYGDELEVETKYGDEAYADRALEITDAIKNADDSIFESYLYYIPEKDIAIINVFHEQNNPQVSIAYSVDEYFYIAGELIPMEYWGDFESLTYYE